MRNIGKNDWQYLIEQYITNKISREEFEKLLEKVGKEEDLDTLNTILQGYWNKKTAQNEGSKIDWEAKFQSLRKSVKEKSPVVHLPSRNRKYIFYRVAASVVLLTVLATGLHFIFFNKKNPAISKTTVNEVRLKNDLSPGSTGAILTLANGKNIVLDSAGSGTLAVQGNTKVISKNGHIIYDDQNETGNELLYNTVTTPKGRQFQLSLADGSKVWLNAASSIRYPTDFLGKERKVEITGEVYFEVAHNKDKPFKVFAKGAEILVLGTNFNVNAYQDEATINTTLLEGSVKISTFEPLAVGQKSENLKPGQQALIYKYPSGNQNISVRDNVDLDLVMGWKNGYFTFDQTDLATVMRQIARWYDVEIVYEGKIPNRRFGGEISRNSNASQVLKILEKSKVYFRIEGKKIIVLP